MHLVVTDVHHQNMLPAFPEPDEQPGKFHPLPASHWLTPSRAGVYHSADLWLTAYTSYTNDRVLNNREVLDKKLSECIYQSVSPV